jgi:hypothetical protein
MAGLLKQQSGLFLCTQAASHYTSEGAMTLQVEGIAIEL